MNNGLNILCLMTALSIGCNDGPDGQSSFKYVINTNGCSYVVLGFTNSDYSQAFVLGNELIPNIGDEVSFEKKDYIVKNKKLVMQSHQVYTSLELTPRN